MKTWRSLAFLAAMIASAANAADGTRTYAFTAFLDDKPIGQHTFAVTTEGNERKVASQADFKVKILGITAYRYRHHADEQWSGDCLSGLASSTDDDGKATTVKLTRRDDANLIQANAGTRSEPGCLMSYAYWNPAMRERTRLLNPQTGKVDAVQVERRAEGHVMVGGREVAATDWRITGGDAPIDVWISAQGEWVGLDSMVSGGKHRLSYRLP
ncbi:MAG: DUF6134 family protein [Vitreoscilla sp.]